jgi:hypothetical protein
MLRMAHRILNQNTIIPAQVTRAGADNIYLKQFETLRQCLKANCPIIIADNVAKYYADTPKQDWELVERNFPCVAPPFEPFWFIEYQNPGYFIGEEGRVLEPLQHCHFGILSYALSTNNTETITFLDQLLRKNAAMHKELVAESKWLILLWHFGLFESRFIFMPFLHIAYVTASGALLKCAFTSPFIRHDDPTAIHLRDSSAPYAHIALLTLNFLHCNNVNRIDVSEFENPPIKWCRRQHLPELKYQMLQIDPSSTRTLRRGRSELVGESDRAFHICRGHFSHYEDDGRSKGLFGQGRYGTFWIPSHTRGSLENGRTISTYKVLTP